MGVRRERRDPVKVKGSGEGWRGNEGNILGKGREEGFNLVLQLSGVDLKAGTSPF